LQHIELLEGKVPGITGYDIKEVKNKITARGPDKYQVRPFTAAELVKKLEEAEKFTGNIVE